jgi:DNA repair exonuclease SbcCD ATPase subunit
VTFKLHSIEITNFRSFKGSHKFDFPTKSGLYFFTGENEVDAIGANGAGKSTFLDAITWCLYGRTARGLKSTDVHSWGDPCSTNVILDLTVGERLIIKRSQKPNTLEVNGTVVDQEGLQKYIKLNFEAFLNSVLFAQFGRPFFDRSPSEKLSMFSDIMNLQFWLDKSDQASKEAKELERELSVAQEKIVIQNGKIVTIREDMTELKAREAAFDAEWDKMSKALHKEYHDLCREIEGKRAAYKNACQQIKFNEEAMDEMRDILSKRTMIRDDLLERVQSIAKRISYTKGQHDNLAATIDQINEGKCPCCGRVISGSFVAGHKQQVRYRLVTLKGELDDLEEDRQMTMASMIGANQDIEIKTNGLAEIRAKVKEAAQQKLSITMWLSNADRELQKIDSKIKEGRKNVFTDMLVSKKKALKLAKEASAEASALKDVVEGKHTATSYWVKGFRQIRLSVIEQAFQTLEVEVNNSLAQLGLPEWNIKFDIERENKSGGITKGFMVFVTSPTSKQPVRWESWSGGETQRLQLAGSLGLANLIMHQNGLASGIEFYDEPSTHLSKEGMLDLANALYDRAVIEDKMIWIVDHAAITNFGEFETTITVTKSKNGSRIST